MSDLNQKAERTAGGADVNELLQRAAAARASADRLSGVAASAGAPQPKRADDPAMAEAAISPSMARNAAAGLRSALAQNSQPPARKKRAAAAKQPDRVVIIKDGRHYIAPVSGRHPVRVAKALHDYILRLEAAQPVGSSL